MCGIAGIALKQNIAVAEGLQTALAQALAHRGPDGEGRYATNGLSLIHRRLSIIDVAGGAQPLSSPSGHTRLVANGEIYNFKALQTGAKAAGFTLQTKSDCEPILWLYEKYGLDFIHHLSGMYALALWDETRQRLLLARDPFGIKPLYYAVTDAGIAFASEPAALARCGWVKSEVNESLLPAFLARQYTGGEETLWQGIQRLLPGELLVIEQGEIKEIHQTPAPLYPPEKVDEASALTQFDELLHTSLTTHVQSDVPYGAFLSGGIDSSTMLVAMQKVLTQLKEPPARTYTIGFSSKTVKDERAIAEKLAADLGTRHTSILFDENDFWHYLPQMVIALDDPVADYASLPLLKLAERAKEDVKVILSGEGGDELFAGYGRYRPKLWARLLGKKMRGSGTVAGAPEFVKPHLRQWAGETFMKRPGLSALQQRQAWDIEDWLPDNLLTKVDRCLMVHGVEGRVPFLDLNLAQFGFSLPDGLKVKGKHGKWLVKNWLSKRQPTHPVWAKKSGFTVPIADWLNNRQNEVIAYLTKVEGLKNVVEAEALKASCTAPWNKKQAKLVFNLLVFAGWWQHHIAKQAPYAGLNG